LTASSMPNCLNWATVLSQLSTGTSPVMVLANCSEKGERHLFG
jgi:hypothetical protein